MLSSEELNILRARATEDLLFVVDFAKSLISILLSSSIKDFLIQIC